jgi:hypothetical protein
LRFGFVTARRLWLIGLAVVLGVSVLTLATGSAQGGVNADGDADVIFARYAAVKPTQDESCRGDGRGDFICTGFNINDTSQGLAVGDLNGDRHLDVVLSSDMTNRNRVCFGDGSGITYTCSFFGPIPNGNAFGVALGDVDSDGDLDAVVARGRRTNQICENDGSGVFACSNISPDTFDTFDVALGDVNNDGNLDAVFSNDEPMSTPPQPGPQRVCLGDGAGGFSCSNIGTETGGTLDRVELGDVNNDDNLDAVFSNRTRQRVCLGDGTGSFPSCRDVDSIDVPARGVALGDINDDRNLDAVFASDSTGGFPKPNRVCLGDGTGSFTCSDLRVGSLDNFDVDLGDVNRDGKLDVAFADTEGSNPVCLGNGRGDFPVSGCTFVGSETQTTRVVIVPPDPLVLIDFLVADVGALQLPTGLTNSLIKKLDGAAARLEDANPSNDTAAANKVQAFSNQVNAQAGKKITQPDADRLIASSEVIIEVIRN